MSGEGSRPRSDTQSRVPQGEASAPNSSFNMAENVVINTSGGSLYLPANRKLKGQENYATWKKDMMHLIGSNGLIPYFGEDPYKPEEVDVFSAKVSLEARNKWLAWKTGDSKAMMVLSYNVNTSLQLIINNIKSTKER